MASLLSDFRALSWLQKGTILLSLILLACSLSQPAFYIDHEDYDRHSDSLILFFLGWMGVLGGSIESFLWAANPVYIISIYYVTKRNISGLWLSITAAGLALAFSLLDTVLASESGARANISSLEAGYWLWVSCFVVMAFGTVLDRYFRKDD